MAYGSDPVVSNSGYGKDAVQGSQQPQPGPIQTGVENFVRGLNTGVAGDVLGAGQIAGSVLPSAITDPIANSGVGQWLSGIANRPTPGFAGTAGNIAGGALPFLVQPELGIGRAVKAAPYIGRGLKTLWDIIRTSTIPSAFQPAENQTERLKNMAIGTGVGGGAHVLGEAAKIPLQKWAGQRAAGRAYDAAREAAQARNTRVTDLNQRIGASNKRYQTRFENERAARDAATYAHQEATARAREAQARVPGQTTLNWWRESLAPIGEQARAPTTVTPESSAQVRRIIGDRLNQVRQRMLLNPADANFQTEMEHIRAEVESRLSNQAMRDQWSGGRNSVFSRFIDEPLHNLQYLSGQQFSDYVSRLGDLAEQYARRAMSAPQAERPELDMISRGLRHVVDAVERHGTGGDAALSRQLADAKRAYNLWSIGNGATAAEKGGVMTPGNIAREWARRQGDAAYGAEMIPGHPQFHPENARLKRGLETARQAHETAPPPAPPRPALRAPVKRSPIPVPKVPPERTVDQKLPGAVSHLAGHIATGLTGSPLTGRIVRGIAHYGGRGVARPTLRTVRGVGKAAPAVAVTPSKVRMGSDQIPEITVRPKPGDR